MSLLLSLAALVLHAAWVIGAVCLLLGVQMAATWETVGLAFAGGCVTSYLSHVFGEGGQ